jgi:hypothetical protein
MRTVFAPAWQRSTAEPKKASQKAKGKSEKPQWR